MKRKLRKKDLRTLIVLGVIAIVLVGAIVLSVTLYDHFNNGGRIPTGASQTDDDALDKKLQAQRDAAAVEALGNLTVPDYVNIDYIEPSRARTCIALTGLHNIVIHYTGNPGTTARQNRNYFGNPDTLVCSHFLIGLDGEIIQCIPLDEQSAASNHRNVDTISIEVCHPDKTGKFNDATYASLVKLTAWLCENTELDENDLIRHHDITGKECPKYFVDKPEEWERFKTDVKNELK